MVTLTGVVPSGESHPEEEGGDEEKSERRENRRLLQRINLKRMSSTKCFVTVSPHSQYQNKRNCLSHRGAFLDRKFLERVALVDCNLFFILVLKIVRSSKIPPCRNLVLIHLSKVVF